jgi:hypothetical protein
MRHRDWQTFLPVEFSGNINCNRTSGQSMTSYRITKYNPEFRDIQGAYLSNDWTSVCDIGKQFDSGELNTGASLEAEERYVNTVLYLWQIAQCPPLYVTDLETNALRHNKAHLTGLPELLRDVAHEPVPKKNQVLLDRVIVARVVRLILRELIWCKLEANTGFNLHFGWDYYMYCVGVELDTEHRNAITDIGLFVEEFHSPYLDRDR